MGWSGRFVRCAFAASVALAALAASTPTAGTQTGPSIAITPNAALTDGQTVTVSGSGWSANTSLNLVSCRANFGSGNDCDAATSVSVTTDGTGQFSTPYVVHQIINPASAPNTDCAGTFGCSLLVWKPPVIPPNTEWTSQTLGFGAARTAQVSGTITNGAGGVPGPQLGVVVCPGTTLPPGAPPPGCALGIASSATGQYTTPLLQPGTYTIGGFGSAGTAVVGAGTPATRTLQDGQHLTGIDFVLGSRIEGIVRDSTNAAVPGATVSLVGGPSSIGGSLAVQTDQNGHYLTPYLGAGTHTLQFQGPGPANLIGRGTVTVAANQTASLDAYVRPPVSVSGTVVGDAGALPDTAVATCPNATSVTPGCPGLSITGASPTGTGAFGFPPVIAGSYAIVGFQWSPGGTFPVVQTSPTVVFEAAPGDAVSCAFVLGSSPSASCTGTTGGDTDGVPTAVEDGAANGGDGNADGTRDAEQENVTSLPNAEDGQYLTVEAPDGTTLGEVEAIDPDTLPVAPPPDASLPVGVISFEVHVAQPGDAANVVLYLPTGVAADTWLKFHDGAWSEFPGASFAGNQVTLALQDGHAGDDDDTENAVIVDPAAPSHGFDFTGFLRPVDNVPTFNTTKAGRAIPVKFSLGGDEGLDVLAGSPTSQAIDCDSHAPFDEIETVVDSAGESSLSYDPVSGQYTYTWKTNRAWQDCRQLVLTLSDGTEHIALFDFR